MTEENPIQSQAEVNNQVADESAVLWTRHGKGKRRPASPPPQVQHPTTYNFQDISNQPFGQWTALYYAGYDGRDSLWWCRCSCGVERAVTHSNLQKKKSCGRAVHRSVPKNRIPDEQGRVICVTCREMFLFTEEFFHKNKRCYGGLNSVCKQCAKKYARGHTPQRNAVLRREVLAHYGIEGKPRCRCCGTDIYKWLTLDHINNDGNIERKAMAQSGIFLKAKRDGFPEGRYQTLCIACNWGKHLNGGVCPCIERRENLPEYII